MSVNLIVAIGRNGEIGKDGELIWKISDDLKRFKALTTGHPVIMGRKTWDSLPIRPLPGRRNIVLTRQADFKEEGAEPAYSISQALSMTSDEDPFVIGGEEIYKAFLPYSDRIYLTEVDSVDSEADAFLNLDFSDWMLEDSSPTMKTPEDLSYRFLIFKRRG